MYYSSWESQPKCLVVVLFLMVRDINGMNGFIIIPNIYLMWHFWVSKWHFLKLRLCYTFFFVNKRLYCCTICKKITKTPRTSIVLTLVVEIRVHLPTLHIVFLPSFNRLLVPFFLCLDLFLPRLQIKQGMCNYVLDNRIQHDRWSWAEALPAVEFGSTT